MSEEIDIEEHDLMDNPRIRNIFPDLTLLKKEIVGPDHEELQKQITLDTSNRPDKVFNRKKNITNYCKLIHIKEEATRPSETQKSKSSLLHSNVIVFGKKPSITTDKILKYTVKINIKDINYHLKKSKRYCHICKTLFSKTKLFDEHKMLNHKHSFENYTDKVEGREDNVRGRQKVIDEGNPTNKCFHCQVIFSTQELLIEHLYEVLNKKAKVRKMILDKDTQMNTNDHQNSQTVNVSDVNVAEKDTDIVKFRTKLDTNCLSETISVDSCEAIPIESESCSALDNQIRVFCDTTRNEAFQCSICSYYFEQQKFYKLHMERKHKRKVEQVNVVKFNPKCAFCLEEYTTVKKYNVHLHYAHSSMINAHPKEPKLPVEVKRSHEDQCDNTLANQQHNTKLLTLESTYDLVNDKPLFFKSVLFKCFKCDIHFLSPILATSHIIHSEILINWKCSLCKIFFKRSDEDLHLKQHKYTESFTVIDVGDTDLCRIMIKCTNCLLYVPKKELRHHLNTCGGNIKSWHCSVCDIDIDGNIKNKREHKNIHSDIDNKRSDFILIDESIINTQTYNMDTASKDDITTCSSVGSDDSEIDSYSPDESIDSIPQPKRRKVQNNVMNKKKSVLKDNKSITEQNALKRKIDKITNQSKKLRRKLLKKYFADKDSYSKFIFKPPDSRIFLLNMAYCKNCECFINFFFMLNMHLEGRCNNLCKRVCNLCGIVFTPKVMIRHKEFHKLNPHLKLQDFKFYDIETCKQILPPMPIYPKCDKCEIYFFNKEEIRTHTCSEIPNVDCDICGEKFASQNILNLHIPFHGYYLQGKETIQNNGSDKESLAMPKEMEDDVSLNEFIKENSVSLSEGSNTNETKEINQHPYYLYTCEFCNVTVDNYDQLVEHCHSHYTNSYKNIDTEECTQCKLLFHRSSIFLHKKMHKSSSSNESFQIFVCDIFNFGRSNAEWLEHVFKSVSTAEREEIIKYATYKNECRIKLEIAQRGDPELTLYRCTKCSIFIDESDIFTHRLKCKGKTKKYPCDYCGIPLVSADHRSRHMELHERRTLNIKSYKIVIFNRLKDKFLNDLISKRTIPYIVNKCRNCDGVVEWRLIKNHQCDFNDLKKCKNCGLLIYNKDYDKHKSKHKSSDSFIDSNMKVVMFGQIRQESQEKKQMVCSFSGIAFDYIFYKCMKCDTCIRELRPSSRHFCLIDAAKWKCSKCLLFFDEGKKKSHWAMHASDPEFTSDAICVIPFDPQKTYQNLEKELNSKGEKEDSKTESEVSLITASYQEKTDVLYRCPCGLHYLTEEDAKKHIGGNKCGVAPKKNLVQTCSKCNLNFTSEILYKHLLQHHADKYIKYSFDIVNVAGLPLKENEDSAVSDSPTSEVPN